jgi:peroxiredoxin
LRGKIKDLEQAGGQLLVVDPHESWPAEYFLEEVGIGKDAVAFPLLQDAAQTVSATYGVAFQMRIHTELSNRPATFVIDREGILRYERRGESFGDRPSIDEILQELQKLQQ